MKKGLGRLLALGLALTALLTACTQTEEGPAGFDAGTYVDGVLKAVYLGEFDPAYLEMVDLTEAEAQAEYNNGVHAEVNNFYSVYSIETSTDEFHEELEEVFHEIYSHASLTVTGVEEREDGSFGVWVEVEPLDIVRQVHEVLPQRQEEFYARYPQDAQNSMSSAQYEAFDAEWANLVLELYKEKLETIGHLPAQTVTLRVEQDSQGYYGINSADFLALDKLVIDYTVPAYEHNHDNEGEEEPTESPTPEESGQPGETGEPDGSPAPEEGEAVQTGGQPAESQGPQESQPPESVEPQESVNPNDPTPPTTGTPIPGLETE